MTGRKKILMWHIHGSYLNAITRVEHDWYLPVMPGRPEGYGGRGLYDLPNYVHEIPAEEVRELELDLIIFQTPKNYQEDQYAILSPQQAKLPRIYLEHNTPKPHPTDSVHPLDDPSVLLVHVTHYNQLMWDNHDLPTCVIEHSVAIDPSLRYSGERQAGITVINGMQARPRITGLDLFLHFRAQIPLEAAGMKTEELGGMGDIPYADLHRRMAGYRFLFSPIRYTSLPLAVIEAMTIGMPVVALATTELPTVIEHGQNGYCSCDPQELRACMQRLLDDPAEARRLGDNARETARTRFSLDRFARDWNAAFERAAQLAGHSFDRPTASSARDLVSASSGSLPQNEEGDAR